MIESARAPVAVRATVRLPTAWAPAASPKPWAQRAVPSAEARWASQASSAVVLAEV
jgi:hypothetical protein